MGWFFAGAAWGFGICVGLLVAGCVWAVHRLLANREVAGTLLSSAAEALLVGEEQPPKPVSETGGPATAPETEDKPNHRKSRSSPA